MRDIGNEETEVLLKKVERKIERTYRRAAYESGIKLQEYLQQFEKADIKKQAEVMAGRITEDAYKKWRKDEMLKGKRWEEMLNTLADDYVRADQIAINIVNGYTPEAYAINRNFAAFEVEKGALVDTSFTLYNQHAVERLVRERPTLLPKPRVDIPKDKRWNKRKIRSEITQGILQGEPIPKVAKRLQKVAGMDNAAALRNARTAITGAQNAGRLDQYREAHDKGIDLMQKWVATLDHRTRDSHAAIDGELINVGGKFSNGLRFPGDPLGRPEEVYNCRCRMVGHLMGFNFSDEAIPRDNRLGKMSYEEWKNEHKDNLLKSSAVNTSKESQHVFQRDYGDDVSFLEKNLGYTKEDAELTSQIISAYIHDPNRVVGYEDEINKFIESMPKWDGRVYRGVPTDKDFKVGESIKEGKISSWTSRKDVAREYSGSAEFDSENAWNLRDGQKSVIFVSDDVGGASISRFHWSGKEKYHEEIITPTYAEYEVVSVEDVIETRGRPVEYVYLKRKRKRW